MGITINKKCWQRNAKVPEIMAIGKNAKEFQAKVKDFQGPDVITMEGNDLCKISRVIPMASQTIAVVAFEEETYVKEIKELPVAIISVTGDQDTFAILTAVKEAITPPPIKILAYGDHSDLGSMELSLRSQGFDGVFQTKDPDVAKKELQDGYGLLVIHDKSEIFREVYDAACQIPSLVVTNQGDKFALEGNVLFISEGDRKGLLLWLKENINKIQEGYPTYRFDFMKTPWMPRKKMVLLMKQIILILTESGSVLTSDNLLIEKEVGENQITITIKNTGGQHGTM